MEQTEAFNFYSEIPHQLSSFHHQIGVIAFETEEIYEKISD